MSGEDAEEAVGTEPAPPGEEDSELDRAFRHRRYSLRRPFWSWTGRTFFVHGPDGRLELVVHSPFWRFRDEVVVYRDEAKLQPVLRLRENKIIAADVRFDVTSAPRGELIGAIVSRGIKSIARDAWDLLDGSEKHLGLMQEGGHALLRRFFPMIKGRYHVEIAGEEVATITQVAGMFSKEYVLEVSADPRGLDTRVALACAILAVLNEPASS